MAILRVVERYRGNESEEDRDNRRYRRVFFVETDSNQHTAREIRLAPGIPRLGNPHDEDVGSLCARVGTPVHVNGSDRAWDVPVEYEVPPDDFSEPTEEREVIKPETVLPRIQINTVERTVAMEKDVLGRPVMNSAGTRLTSVPEVDRSYIELIINGRVAFESYTPELSERFRDKLNNKTFFGFAEVLTARVKSIHAQTEDSEFIQPDGSTVVRTVWLVNMVFHIIGSWTIEILDEGVSKNPGGVQNLILPSGYILGGGTGPPISVTYDALEVITDSNGEAVREPVLLNGNGEPLVAGQPPVFIEYYPYFADDFDELFDALGFPKDLASYKVEFTKQES